MRRIVVVATAVVALLGALSPPASAQAPAPKVTINGLIDVVTFAGWNQSWDGDFTRKNDTEWRSRQRGVYVITGEVGKAKGVLSLEMDIGWGMTTAGFTGSALSAGGPTQPANIPFIDANAGNGVDLLNAIEIKNMYIEFPVPWIPFPTVARLGAHPMSTTYKVGALANTDLPGVTLTSTFSPLLKANFYFAQFDEQALKNANRDLGRGVNSVALQGANTRGDDFMLVGSVDVTPFKGLDVKPLYAYFRTDGGIVSSVNSSGIGFQAGRGGLAGASVTATGNVWERHYVGVDARGNFGPFYLDPTFIYLTGEREVSNGVGNRKIKQDNRSYLADVEAGYRAGPLTTAVRAMFQPGNRIRDNVAYTGVYRVYHPITTDGIYGSGWTEFMAGGTVDYLQQSSPMGSSPSSGGGFDQYGRLSAGFRPSYALTPAFTIRGLVVGHWTPEDIDTDGSDSILTGRTPRKDRKGDTHYIGTELSGGIVYQFLPGLTFDWVYAYLVAGDGLNQCGENIVGGDCRAPVRDAKNAQLTAARVRFQF